MRLLHFRNGGYHKTDQMTVCRWQDQTPVSEVMKKNGKIPENGSMQRPDRSEIRISNAFPGEIWLLSCRVSLDLFALSAYWHDTHRIESWLSPDPEDKTFWCWPDYVTGRSTLQFRATNWCQVPAHECFVISKCLNINFASYWLYNVSIFALII